MNKELKELIELDKERLSIRNNYKKKIINKYHDKNNTEQDYVYFPKFLISENNEQLRYGIS